MNNSTPLPEPEPWETTGFCYARGLFFARIEAEDRTYWIEGDCCPRRYERDELASFNPEPVAIGLPPAGRYGKPTDAEVAALIDSLAEQAGVTIMPLTASMALQDARHAAQREEEAE